MYEKTIKFKLDDKFFNKFGYLDNKYIYDWLNLARKYFLNSLGIDVDLLLEHGLYYSDIDVKFSIKRNIKKNNQDMYIKTTIEKHNGVRTVFSYDVYIDNEIVVYATSSHNILKADSDRSIRIDRVLPKWDQVLKDIVTNDL